VGGGGAGGYEDDALLLLDELDVGKSLSGEIDGLRVKDDIQ